MSHERLPWTPWHRVVTLREDVRTGELSLADFAADLHDVMMQRGARPTYEDPARFFALTFPTFSLRELAKDVVLRLAGRNTKAVRQLELTYGGGKTHTLVTLRHLAHDPEALPNLPAVEQFKSHVGAALTPARVAALAFDKLDVEKGMEVRGPQGELRWLKHPWSVLAFQIAGGAGIEALHAEGRDEEREMPPAEPLLVELLARHEFRRRGPTAPEGPETPRDEPLGAVRRPRPGGLESLRDIVGNLCAQPHKLYHLGLRALVSRSSLARVNAEQPYTLYEALFKRLLARCQQRAPRHGFRFKNPFVCGGCVDHRLVPGGLSVGVDVESAEMVTESVYHLAAQPSDILSGPVGVVVVVIAALFSDLVFCSRKNLSGRGELQQSAYFVVIALQVLVTNAVIRIFLPVAKVERRNLGNIREKVILQDQLGALFVAATLEITSRPLLAEASARVNQTAAPEQVPAGDVRPIRAELEVDV